MKHLKENRNDRIEKYRKWRKEQTGEEEIQRDESLYDLRNGVYKIFDSDEPEYTLVQGTLGEVRDRLKEWIEDHCSEHVYYDDDDNEYDIENYEDCMMRFPTTNLFIEDPNQYLEQVGYRDNIYSSWSIKKIY